MNLNAMGGAQKEDLDDCEVSESHDSINDVANEDLDVQGISDAEDNNGAHEDFTCEPISDSLGDLQIILKQIPESLLMQEVASRVERDPYQEVPEMVRQISSFQGPLPPPIMLAQYEDICPGLANRIVCLTERQQAHRINVESRSVTASIWNERLGQIFAFIICIFTLIGSIWLISEGYAISGSLLAGGTMTGLAYIFITGRKQSEKSEDE